MSPSIAGASDDVLRRHAQQHPCEGGALSVACPCGDTILIVCDECGQPLFAGVRPGTWCVHVRPLFSEVAA